MFSLVRAASFSVPTCLLSDIKIFPEINNKLHFNNDFDIYSNLNSNLDSIQLLCTDRMTQKILIIYLNLPSIIDLICKQKHNTQLTIYSPKYYKHDNIHKNDYNGNTINNDIDINSVFDIIPVSTTSSTTYFYVLHNSCITRYYTFPLITVSTIQSV